ncbi:MAG: WGR domain-containing protein [Myxococcales bacterium]|nr:WGR domain-containing protein [Myxococcales bacterium]
MSSRRRLELIEGSSSKFWEIEVEDDTHLIRFGRIGAVGQTKEKAFATAGVARGRPASSSRRSSARVTSRSTRTRSRAPRRRPSRRRCARPSSRRRGTCTSCSRWPASAS